MSRLKFNRLAVFRSPSPSPPPVPPATNVIRVTAGTLLQPILDAAQPGDAIELEAGATFTGVYSLGIKSLWVELRGASQVAGSTVIHSPNNSPCLQTVNNAAYWRIKDLTFTSGHEQGEFLRLGSNTQTEDQMAHDFVVERIWCKGSPTVGKKRGIALNTASTEILDSRFTDIKLAGQESQAIAGWNGPGPYRISGNYIEAAGVPILFGGSDPSIVDMVPSDIEVSGNHIHKPLSWKTESWLVKNLFELKTGRRVRIFNNLFENNWATAGNSNQGYSFWFKTVNQDGGGTWNQTYDVEFYDNIATGLAAGINLHRNPPNAGFYAQPFSLFTVRNSYFEIDSRTHGGVGVFLQVWGMDDVTVDHVTAISDGFNTIYVSEETSPNNERFILKDSIFKDNNTGIKGPTKGEGLATLNHYFSGYVMAGNLVQSPNPSLYPAGNNYVTSLEAAGYNSATRLLDPSSAYKGTATDGTDPGWAGV